MRQTRPAQGKQRPASADHRRFADRVVDARKKRGFPTAYGFFHKNGGKTHFGFSYLHYLLIERGLRLPSVASLRAILEVVAREATHSEDRLAILTCYLKALTGGDPIFDPVLAHRPLPAAADLQPPPLPGETVPAFREDTHTQPAAESDTDRLVRLAASTHKGSIPRMSREQVEAVLSSPAGFWVFQWLLQTGLRLDIAGLSESLELKTPDVLAATARLQQVGLIRRLKDGRFEAPAFQTDLFEPMALLTPERKTWINGQINARVRAQGEDHAHGYYLLFIDDEQKTQALKRVFWEALSKAYLLRPRTPAKGSGKLYAVEARVAPVFERVEPKARV